MNKITRGVCRLTALFVLAIGGNVLAGVDDRRERLAQVLTNSEESVQIEMAQKLAEVRDPMIEQVLTAWRQGSIYLYETPDSRQVPFLLDAITDASGKARGLMITTGEPIKDASGQVLLFTPSELTAVDTSAKLRKAIKTTLDLLALNNPNPNMRRDAITKLGLEQNEDYLRFFESRLTGEKNEGVRKALQEAIAVTQLGSEQKAQRLAAIERLGQLRSIVALDLVKQRAAQARKNTNDVALFRAAQTSLRQIEEHIEWGNFIGTIFRGLSLSSVLLVAAIGLAITFGLMGIINMAHGEMIMLGAYTAYVTQNLFLRWFGPGSRGFDCYFIAAIPFSFLTAGLVGLALERGVIRFLYRRPLESLLATWGVSLVLQQLMRATYGPANVQVNSPSWLSGNFAYEDVNFAYNRIFVIGFAITIVAGTWLLLTKTSLGLQVRAVMQNRSMAACLGVRTDRVNMATFTFGSGLAGMAGACLSQIGNVGPSLGQNHIVDCFMVVVLGGVGNLAGTVSSALGIGVTDQILQPYLGAVLGKITVLAAIILFLQWRPAGLFVPRSRGLEG